MKDRNSGSHRPCRRGGREGTTTGGLGCWDWDHVEYRGEWEGKEGIVVLERPGGRWFAVVRVASLIND